MKRVPIVFVVVLAICLGVMWSLAAAPATVQPAGARAWKYSVVTLVSYPTLKKRMWVSALKIPETATSADALNAMGAEGWELVSVNPDSGQSEPFLTAFYFKR